MKGIKIVMVAQSHETLRGGGELGIFVKDRTGISIDLIIIRFNVILFLLAGFLFSFEIAMYSVLTYIITAKTKDLILEGFGEDLGLMIVTSKPKDMQRTLLRDIGQGMPIYQGIKGYGSQGEKQNVEIIHTVVTGSPPKKFTGF